MTDARHDDPSRVLDLAFQSLRLGEVVRVVLTDQYQRGAGDLMQLADQGRSIDSDTKATLEPMVGGLFPALCDQCLNLLVLQQSLKQVAREVEIVRLFQSF